MWGVYKSERTYLCINLARRWKRPVGWVTIYDPPDGGVDVDVSKFATRKRGVNLIGLEVD